MKIVNGQKALVFCFNSFWGAFWSNSGLLDWMVDCPKLGTAVNNRSPASRKWISRTRAVRKYFRIDFPILHATETGNWRTLHFSSPSIILPRSVRFRSRELRRSQVLTVLQPLNWTKSVVRRRRSIWLVDFDLTCKVGLFVFALIFSKPKLLFAPASDNRQLRWRGGRMEAYHNHLLAVAIIGYHFRSPELFSLAHLESAKKKWCILGQSFYWKSPLRLKIMTYKFLQPNNFHVLALFF